MSVIVNFKAIFFIISMPRPYTYIPTATIQIRLKLKRYNSKTKKKTIALKKHIKGQKGNSFVV